MTFLEEAIQHFQKLLNLAKQTNLNYPNAMTVSTVDAQGKPSSRILLLKDFDISGFVFYTNQKSRKSRQLAENKNTALAFYWQQLHAQVHIEGIVEKVTVVEADKYWATRPRQSRIGAWASQQSENLANREELQQRYDKYEKKFKDMEPPRPEHWSGYRVLPNRIEFWEEQPYRLHKRVCYKLSANNEWSRILLNP
jgi:pyridoxamine 5'-phosphate oxidase